MKHTYLLLFCILMMFFYRAGAQNNMMAGRITFKDGQPAKGAILQIGQGKEALETGTDDEGFFYAKQLPEGFYKVVIKADGHNYKLDNLPVVAATEKKYYYFNLDGSKAVVNVAENDPLLKDQVESQPRLDYGRIHIIYDKSGDSSKKIFTAPPQEPAANFKHHE